MTDVEILKAEITGLKAKNAALEEIINPPDTVEYKRKTLVAIVLKHHKEYTLDVGRMSEIELIDPEIGYECFHRYLKKLERMVFELKKLGLIQEPEFTRYKPLYTKVNTRGYCNDPRPVYEHDFKFADDGYSK